MTQETQFRVGIGNCPMEVVSISPNATKGDLERGYNEINHQISLQKKCIAKEQETLQRFQDGANTINAMLNNLEK